MAQQTRTDSSELISALGLLGAWMLQALGRGLLDFWEWLKSFGQDARPEAQIMCPCPLCGGFRRPWNPLDERGWCRIGIWVRNDPLLWGPRMM